MFVGRLGIVLTVVAAIVAAFVSTAPPLGSEHDRVVAAQARFDTDGDGLTDAAENEGWHTASGDAFRTDASDADTDADGLNDGDEAGAVRPSEQFGSAYVGVSDPTRSDTDGDGVGDAEEFVLDTDPWDGDTDHDDLDDATELAFDSDPTLPDADEDGYDDREEYDRDSDPSAYDLDRTEAAAATVAGATFGDCDWCAHHVGINDEQLQSPEYLAGQLISGFVGLGDVRDLVADAGRGDFTGAVVSLLAIVPGPGDAAKTADKVARFAQRSERAKQAALDLTDKLPLPSTLKNDLGRRILGSSKRTPWLDGGPRTSLVYVARSAREVVYCGITSNFARRQAQHATRFDIAPITSLVTRREARSIEEACIMTAGLGQLQNKIHSISPSQPHYTDALAWGRDELAKAKVPGL